MRREQFDRRPRHRRVRPLHSRPTTGLPPLLALVLALGMTALLSAPSPAGAQLDPVVLNQLQLEVVTEGMPGSPVAVTHAGDPRLFITFQQGSIRIWDGQEILPQPFLDLSDQVSLGSERGLFSVAFHPLYPQTPFFFVNYTNLQGNTIIARYRVSQTDPDRADPDSGVTLMEIAQPFANHNGGQLQFGPDGMLYIGMGDGGAANDPQCNAQRTDTLLGKLLRIDVDTNAGTAPFFAAPPDNPFFGPGGFADEVWASGLRNPWRFSFDRQTGALYIGDVGQSLREEVNFQPAASTGGENYGWKRLEGNLCLDQTSGCPVIPPCGSPEYTDPILDYNHDDGNCSVTGGYVYRGDAIPGLRGTYLFADLCVGRLRAAARQGDQWQTTELALTVPPLVTSFGEDLAGELYVVNLQGTLYRITGPGAPPPDEAGTVRFLTGAVSIGEEAGQVQVQVARVAGQDGRVTARVTSVDGSATAGEDYQAVDRDVVFEDGDDGPVTVTVPLIGDALLEGPESLRLELAGVTGGANLGSPAVVEVTLEDDDVPAGPCVESDTVLCLVDDRFHLEARFRTDQGTSGVGTAEGITADTGYFWFFEEDNVEVVVKVLDACPVNERFWVFAGGLTNVEVDLVVVDTQEGAVARYRNPQTTAFLPIQDTGAFATCP